MPINNPRATILDATPENSNGEECDVCKAIANMPCVYSTNPPIARDRMHYQRVEAARRTEMRNADQPARDGYAAVTIETYEKTANEIASGLRELADDVLRQAQKTRFPRGEISRASAAVSALDTLHRGIANLHIDKLISNGIEADGANREAK